MSYLYRYERRPSRTAYCPNLPHKEKYVVLTSECLHHLLFFRSILPGQRALCSKRLSGSWLTQVWTRSCSVSLSIDSFADFFFYPFGPICVCHNLCLSFSCSSFFFSLLRRPLQFFVSPTDAFSLRIGRSTLVVRFFFFSFPFPTASVPWCSATF